MGTGSFNEAASHCGEYAQNQSVPGMISARHYVPYVECTGVSPTHPAGVSNFITVMTVC